MQTIPNSSPDVVRCMRSSQLDVKFRRTRVIVFVQCYSMSCNLQQRSFWTRGPRQCLVRILLSSSCTSNQLCVFLCPTCLCRTSFFPVRVCMTTFPTIPWSKHSRWGSSVCSIDCTESLTRRKASGEPDYTHSPTLCRGLPGQSWLDATAWMRTLARRTANIAFSHCGPPATDRPNPLPSQSQNKKTDWTSRQT